MESIQVRSCSSYFWKKRSFNFSIYILQYEHGQIFQEQTDEC